MGFHYDIDESNKIKPNQAMTHCLSVSKSDDFEITYLVDTQLDVIEKAVKLYGGKGFQNVSSTFGLDDPQFVIISVPTYLHLQTATEITKAWNPQILLVEKPFGSSSLEARELRALLEKQGSKVYVNYFRRYLPNVLLLKSSIEFAKRGNLKSVKVDAYGSLQNIFSHFLDLLIMLETTNVLGTTKKTNLVKTRDYLQFNDPITGIIYELNGLGLEARKCEMTLEYDTCVIQMHDNGRSFEILDNSGISLETFILTDSIFNSYQSIVLQAIGDTISHSSSTNCVEDAIRVHDFIESI